MTRRFIAGIYQLIMITLGKTNEVLYSQVFAGVHRASGQDMALANLSGAFC